MKKLLSLVLLLGLVAFTGCDDDDEKADSCGQLVAATEAISDALDAYLVDFSVESCEAYAEALQDWIDVASNCDQVDQTELEDIQASLDELDCSAS